MGVSTIFLIFVIFVSLHDGGHAHNACPPAFEHYWDRCYKFMDLQASWPEAKEYCAVMGGDLASINSARDQTILVGLISKHHGSVSNERYWLDGSDMLDKKEWRWMQQNGTSVPFSYTNWYPGEPNMQDEHCLEIRYTWDSKWVNAQCHILLSFICQARANFNGREKMRATKGDVLKRKEEVYL